MRRKLEIAMSALVLLGAFFFAKEGARLTQALKVEGSGACVVVDAGHGGSDPGKIGVNNEKEKDINLKIAKKLKELLEQAGVRVVMTRTEDK